MKTGMYVALWLVVNLVMVEFYNLVATYAPNGSPTVSETLSRWFRQWPALAVLVGLILGHLLFSMAVRNQAE